MIPDNNITKDNDLPWINRFEIPLTMVQTDSILDIIQNIKYNKYIHNVYLPVYGMDGFSGRPFFTKEAVNHQMAIPGYNKTKKDWIKLISEIAKHKKVSLTVPFTRNIDLIKEYVDYGVSEIMVNTYWEQLDQIKDKIKISRSILAHHDSSEPIDKRFDAAVIPYRKTMDLAWLEENSKNFELIAIINNYCVIECPLRKYKEEFIKRLVEGKPKANENSPFCPECLRYGKTTSAMLPREIVIKLSKYISRYKLVERASSPAAYIGALNYFIYDKLFCFDSFDPKTLVRENLSAEKLLKIIQDKENNFRGSKLETLNCKFQCAECNNKCFRITDWNVN